MYDIPKILKWGSWNYQHITCKYYLEKQEIKRNIQVLVQWPDDNPYSGPKIVPK